MVTIQKVVDNLKEMMEDLNPPERFELHSLEALDVGRDGVRIKVVMQDKEGKEGLQGQSNMMWHIHLSAEERKKRSEKKPSFLTGGDDD